MYSTVWSGASVVGVVTKHYLCYLQVNAECITLCVIDDCLDSDVPLLEVSLSELQVEQVLILFYELEHAVLPRSLSI